MAAQSKLAEHYIEFTSRGVSEAERAVDSIREKYDKLGGSAERAGSLSGAAGRLIAAAFSAPGKVLGGLQTLLDGAARKLADIASLAQKLAAGGAGFVGFFARGAAKDTVEGERLARSFELLTRVVGDIFAPYLRVLSEGLVSVARWFNGLDQSMKDNIARWLLIGTAVAGVVAVLPAVLTGLGAVVGVLAALASPLGLAAGGLLALAAYFSGAAESGLDWGERVTRAIDFVLTGWVRFKQGLAAVDAYVSTAMDNLVESVAAFSVNAYKAVEWYIDNFTALWQDAFHNVTAIAKNLWDNVSTYAGAAWKALRGDLDGALADLARPLNDLDADLQKTTSKFPDLVKANWVSPLEAARQAAAGFADELAGTRGRAEGIVGAVKGALDRVKGLFAGNAGGFQIKAQVGFESLGGTFERLQKAFADQSGLRLQEAQLGQLGDIRQAMQKVAAEGVKVVNLIPPVGS